MAQASPRDLALHLRRAPTISERQWPWLSLALLLVGGLMAVLAWLWAGGLDHLDRDLFGRNLRGYTAFGEFTGVVSLLLLGLTFGFTLRKRLLQERWMPGKGTMMTWLWVHVYAGLLSLAVAALHAGFGLFDYRVTSGKLLFWLLAAVVLSGVVWRLVYRVIPQSLAPKIGNYAQSTSLARVEQQQMEIEKRVAGGSTTLHQLRDWLLQAPRSALEIQQASQTLAAPEQEAFARICELAQSRERALGRLRLQKQGVRRLQGWRILHVPVSLLLPALIVVHLLAVYDVLPTALRDHPVLGANARAWPAVSGEHSATECRRCHAAIYEEWRHSMHAHALTSPVMIVQNNQAYTQEFEPLAAPDPEFICVNCHAPSEARLTGEGMLPYRGEALNEGINCTVCHQFAGQPRSGSGGLSNGVTAQLAPGSTMLGAFAGAVGNTYHKSRQSALFRDDPSALCQNCHDVHWDRDENGRIEIGPDLVLQSTYQEYLRYRNAGGISTCTGCHMPQVKGNRAASSARIPLDQDFAAADRSRHSHAFVGVDYLLSHPPEQDPHREIRHSLLQSAARLKIDKAKYDADNERLRVDVSIANVGAGHSLPSGFAFARQMWLEVTVTDRRKRRVFASGRLEKPSNDLCDRATLNESNGPIREHIVGCEAADPQLVNFQRRLVDKTTIGRDEAGEPLRNARGELVVAAAEGAHEVSIQRVQGGPVVRKRPSDGQALASIDPGATRRFSYQIPAAADLERVEVRVRLLFRHLPPYFLRDLATRQPPDELPRLAPLIKHLEVVEMATARRRIRL